MSKSNILERNLLALSANHAELGRLLTRTDTAEDVHILKTRSGHLVPAYTGGARSIQMHSTVDPVREGSRFFENYRGPGYLVFLGLGGGYHIRPFLDSPEVSRIIVVEKDLSLLRCVLEPVSYTHLRAHET